VSEAGKRRRETIQAPYGRLIRLDEVDFEGGMRLLRVTIREGARFTILDLDAATATQWGRAMCDWALDAGAPGPKGGE
jgi:hypothetical protein